jgi:hypothetical protein
MPVEAARGRRRGCGTDLLHLAFRLTEPRDAYGYEHVGSSASARL